MRNLGAETSSCRRRWFLAVGSILADVSALGVCSSGNQDPPRQRSGVEAGLEATGPVKPSSWRTQGEEGGESPPQAKGSGRRRAAHRRKGAGGGEVREESLDDGPSSRPVSQAFDDAGIVPPGNITNITTSL